MVFSVRAGVTQLVECDLAKVDVAGSNPVSRSRKFGPPRVMIKYLLPLFSCAILAFAQDYKMEPISGAAPGLPAAYAGIIDNKGFRIVGPSGPWCEVWVRSSMATGPKSADRAVTLPI